MLHYLRYLTGLFKKHQRMQRYVSTVVLSDDLTLCAVIRKNRPPNLANKLNAIGGHIEPGEGMYDAAVREIKEECGLTIDKRNLDFLGNLSDTSYTWDVACFTVVMPVVELKRAKTMTDEVITVLDPLTVLADPTTDEDFAHLLLEALRFKNRQRLYDGARNIKFTPSSRN